MNVARLRGPALSALAVLTLSGAGIALAANDTPTPTPVVDATTTPAVEAAEPVEPAGTDTDTLQEGDQTTPDSPAEAAAEAAGTEAETPGTETESTVSDGPGGHADDPNDPNADHQFEGEE